MIMILSSISIRIEYAYRTYQLKVQTYQFNDCIILNSRIL